MTILITRPEQAASATAARLAACGFETLIAPCLTIARLPMNLPERPAAIIVTSSNAVPGLPSRFHDIRIFCVGDATAGRLRGAGFKAVESANGDARDLFRLVTAHRLPGTHLLATGRGHGLDLAKALRSAGVPVLRRTVYAAKPAPVLPVAVKTALRDGAIGQILFYSAETARAFARLQPPGTAAITACALSPAVADALNGLPWAAIRVALAPTEADLLALLT